MKQAKIILNDVRIFENAAIELNGKSSVFFGINGAGKSTLLRCINLLYADLINKTVNRDELRVDYDLTLDDIRNGAAEAKITGVLEFKGSEFSYSKSIIRRSGAISRNGDLGPIVDSIQDAYISDDKQGNIPIFASYGTNRQVLDIPLEAQKDGMRDVYSAYKKAINTSVDFSDFFDWFRNKEDEENALKVQHGDLLYEDKTLGAVRKAILAMLSGFDKLHVVRGSRLSMAVEKDGETLKVSQLSDGEKCTLALLGDIARRLGMANPGLDDPLNGEGVVLIDEIELHMHPLWQRRILKALKSTFPNIQFIITTHSPQVLGEVDDSYNIFALKKESGGNLIVEKRNRMDGLDSNYILEEIMGTGSRSEMVDGLIRSIYALIDARKYDEADAGIKRLRLLAGDDNEDVISATMLIKRRQSVS